MTIKQQGGIFGRNPTFNEVEASDLTVRASVPTITIADTDTTGTHILKASNANFDISADPSGVQAGSGIRFFVDGDEKVKIDSNGNLIISNSGNGIDFSATSGTGTSELFDDYEEGNWNPVPFGSTTAGTYTTAFIRGDYVLVGKLCYISCTVAATGFTGTGNFNIAGLPFVAANQTASLGQVQANTFPFATLTSTNQNIVAQFGTNITFRATSSVAGGSYVTPQCSASTIGYLRVSGCYEVA